MVTEKAKGRFDMTAEELERLIVQKEGENVRETAMQGQNRAGGVNGKRALGKAVQKGGLLLKGKNPNSVSFFEPDNAWLKDRSDGKTRRRRKNSDGCYI